MPFAAVVEVSALDGTNGFQISGEAANDYVGKTVAAAGDINGDGIQDFIVSASGIDPNGSSSGGAYVVFGRLSGFPAELNLSTLNGANGFQINGEATSITGGGTTAGSVSAAGDVNGDGIDDLVIGGFGATTNAQASGAAWVLFGKNTAVSGNFSANVELSALNGTTGFQLNGIALGDQAGAPVASAGDINGDGFDDIAISAYRISHGGQRTGSTYIVFGTSTPFAANFELSSLNGTNGFRIDGESAYSYAGFSVASAGDINNDGIDDLVVGLLGQASGTGGAYVVFGKNTAVSGNFTSTFNLGSLNGANGFQLNGVATGDRAGITVAAAGDVNGDGIDDFVVGAYAADTGGNYSGATYVVFGKDTSVSGAFSADFNLSSLNGTNGFRIDGQAGDYSGRSVVGAGDINGDGIDDLLISAYRAAPNGAYSGAAYVLFGRNTSFAASVSLGSLTTATGVRINGEAASDNFGGDVSAADINGDGLVDLIISAAYADPGGNSTAGAAYVIFGQQGASPFVGTPGEDNLSGTAGADTADGGAGKDILRGLGGDDVLNGGDANDQIFGGANNDILGGDAGSDILYGDDGTDTLNGGDGADKLFGGTGSDQLNGGTGNDRMAGEADVDTLNGGAGNDYLDGGLGADIMSGGTDNDVYIVDNTGDQTIESAGQGYDIVRTALDGWTLGANLEGLELQGSADIDGTGNADANNLQGNSGANTLSGLAGVDTINGNDGDDVIIGGAGNDLLRGGLGQDTFVVAHAFGAVLETDQIYDFSAAEGDSLDLSGAFAGTLDVVSAFSKTAGEMTLTFAGGITTVRLDINGDGKADYQVKINGDVTTESGNWLL